MLPNTLFDESSATAFVLTTIAVFLLFIAASMFAMCLRRARQWVVLGYIQRREEQLAELVLETVFTPDQLQQFQSMGSQDRVVLSQIGIDLCSFARRPFDMLIIERMLLRQAVELRGSDREMLTEVFESCGLVERAIRQLSAWRWWKRLSAAHTLGVMRSKRAVPALIRAANDRHQSVRIAVLQALGEINDERAYTILLDALEDEAPQTAVRVADIVLMLGPTLTPHLIERFIRPRAAAKQALYVRLLAMLREPAALDQMLALLTTPDLYLLIEVIDALGTLGDAQAVAELRGMLGHAHEQVRARAAKALGRIGARSSLPQLRKLLGDPAWIVRYNAACAIAEFGYIGTKTLQNAVQSPDSYAVGIAQQVLAEQALGLLPQMGSLAPPIILSHHIGIAIPTYKS